MLSLSNLDSFQTSLDMFYEILFSISSNFESSCLKEAFACDLKLKSFESCFD